MKSDFRQDMFDENLGRLLKSAAGPSAGDFQERVQDAVLAEVSRQRSILIRGRLLRGVWAAAAVVVLAWALVGRQMPDAARVRPIYGAVEVAEDGVSRIVSSSEQIRSGQSIRTLAGSTAQITLRDGTVLTMSPRAVLQIADGSEGPAVRLQRGSVEVTAAHQRSGRAFVVEMPGSRIKTLGTVFDVRLARRPDGSSRTGVAVRSGLVEFESAAVKVLLRPNTEGFADEGQAPERHLTDPRLNDVLQLMHRNVELAGQLGKRAGAPAVIEYVIGGTATVWTIVKQADFRQAGPAELSLRLKSPASGAALFTLDGRRVPARAKGLDLRLDVSAMTPEGLILELRDVKGIFQSATGDEVRFTAPGDSPEVLTLLQFRLPEQVHVERISPQPLETVTKRGKLTITIPTDAERFTVWE